MDKNLGLTAWGVAAFVTSIISTSVPGMTPVAEAVPKTHPECREETLPAAPLLTDKDLIGRYFTTSDTYTYAASAWPANP